MPIILEDQFQDLARELLREKSLSTLSHKLEVSASLEFQWTL